MNRKSKLIQMLRVPEDRPTTDEALEYSRSEVLEAAEAMKYPLNMNHMDKVDRVHDAFMPFAEELMVWLLRKEEGRNPDYYAFARDAQLIYDALSGLGQNSFGDLAQRTHLMKVSTGMSLISSDDERQYFWDMGVNQERIENGPPIVFIDSGFLGSLFKRVKDFASIDSYFPNENMSGYLIKRSPYLNTIGRTFEQLGGDDTAELLTESQVKNIIYAVLDSPYNTKFPAEDFNGSFAEFLQLSPKYTGKYVEVIKGNDGNLKVLTERNSLASKLGVKNPSLFAEPSDDQYTSLSARYHSVNADVINPVASLLLQQKTLLYFSSGEVQERVSSKIHNPSSPRKATKPMYHLK